MGSSPFVSAQYGARWRGVGRDDREEGDADISPDHANRLGVSRRCVGQDGRKKVNMAASYGCTWEETYGATVIHTRTGPSARLRSA